MRARKFIRQWSNLAADVKILPRDIWIHMTELDRAWAQVLQQAAGSAEGAGREDLADYLRLKASNDLIRTVGVDWLVDTTLTIASPFMRDIRALTVERIEPHTFRWGNSTMIGIGLEMRLGIRCMLLEAGWARRPSDGIMKQGALAYCRLSHFGIPQASEEYRLVRAEPLPTWSTADGTALTVEMLERHLHLLLDS